MCFVYLFCLFCFVMVCLFIVLLYYVASIRALLQKSPVMMMITIQNIIVHVKEGDMVLCLCLHANVKA